jgi:hypothetical protein
MAPAARSRPVPLICSTDPLIIAAGDKFLSTIVPATTSRSAAFIVWDENDYTGQIGCCGPHPNGIGGGHVAGFVITSDQPGIGCTITRQPLWSTPLEGGAAR